MFRLFFCLLLVWGSNKFERDFSLFCLVFWAFRFPLKIVFQGYDYQSHSYTQFACLHMFQVYIHRVPFLVTRAFQDHFFNTDTRTFVLRLLIFFWKYFAQGSLSSLFPVQHFITLPQILCIHLRNRDSSRSSPSSHPGHRVAVSVALLNKEAKNVMFEILNKLIWYTMWPKVPMNSERGKVFVLQVIKMKKVVKKV